MVRYEHGDDRPREAKGGHKPENMYGCMDFKGEAADQAFGQAGKAGVESDHRKIMAQHFSGAYSDDTSGYP